MDFNKIREKLISETKKKISEEFSKKDLQIVKMVDCLESLDKVFNIMIEKIREWFMLYDPETEYKIQDHEKLLKYILNWDGKSEFGAKITDEQLKLLKEFSNIALQVKSLRKKVEEEIEKLTKDLCPNATAIAPPLLIARYIERAGNLEKLAKYPASTIQVLGAEKALFIHLSKGTPPPKHGILFQHPLVRNSPKKIRGKIARFLANKLAIAFREDFYGKKDIRDLLKKELEEKLEELNKSQ
jgi:nucleolar protein 56